MDVAAEEQARAARAWNSTHYLPAERDSAFDKAQLAGDFVGMLASARALTLTLTLVLAVTLTLTLALALTLTLALHLNPSP